MWNNSLILSTHGCCLHLAHVEASPESLMTCPKSAASEVSRWALSLGLPAPKLPVYTAAFSGFKISSSGFLMAKPGPDYWGDFADAT